MLRIRPAYCLLVVCLLGGLCLAAPGTAWAASEGETAAKSVVVIDPGHGGDDPGLKLSETGIAEKEFTLKVAQELKTILTHGPLVAVWLTRTKDQPLSLNARQAFANAKNAQVFVSLHASDTDLTRPAVFIFTHHVTSDEALKSLADKARDDNVPTVLWDQAQAPVKSQSRALAKAINHAWEAAHDSAAPVVYEQEIPVGVLTGVKAPAVLLEMPLPGTPGAKAYETACKQSAKIIAAGIRDFLDRR